VANAISVEVLKKLFGDEFAERYAKALAEAQKIPRERLEEIKRFALEAMKGRDDFRVQYGKMDVILVQSPFSPERFRPVKTSAGNWKATVVWAGSRSMRGPFVSVFVSDKETAEELVRSPGRPWLLVGKLQERLFEGDVTYSFRALGVVPLE